MGLTAKRLEKLKPVLDKYNGLLAKNGKFNAREFEEEARIALNNMWYQQFKLIAIDLLSNIDYSLVSRYYMENLDTVCMCTEFKLALGRL